jgi:hypothetical protein
MSSKERSKEAQTNLRLGNFYLGGTIYKIDENKERKIHLFTW